MVVSPKISAFLFVEYRECDRRTEKASGARTQLSLANHSGSQKEIFTTFRFGQEFECMSDFCMISTRTLID
jgi:hypothetical protein